MKSMFSMLQRFLTLSVVIMTDLCSGLTDRCHDKRHYARNVGYVIMSVITHETWVMS